jgi:hypothetical protein
MLENIYVQNGTTETVGRDIATVNADAKISVTVYMSDREKFTSEFNQWSKKTAQATLEMCRVVYEAKHNLSKDEFKIFSNDIGSRSTIVKYLAIGEKYDKFHQYADLLPNSWSSIYEITQIPSEMFEAFVMTESSMANMTGDQIKMLMGKCASSKPQSSASTAAASTAAASTSAASTAAASTAAASTAAASTSADSSAQTWTEASEDIEAASSKTEAVEAATASSDASMTDSSVSVADISHAATDQIDDKSSNASDRDFAKQATSTMLEQAATATATTKVDASPKVSMTPYEVLIRFNSIPTDNTWFDLVEEIENLVDKYDFDVDVVETRPAFV